MSQENKTLIWPAIRRLLQLSDKNQFWLYAAIGIVVLETGFRIAYNFTIAEFVDAVSAGQYAVFWRYALITLALLLTSVPLSFLRTRCVGLFSEHTLAALRYKVANQAVLLPMRVLEERHSGDLGEAQEGDAGEEAEHRAHQEEAAQGDGAEAARRELSPAGKQRGSGQEKRYIDQRAKGLELPDRERVTRQLDDRVLQAQQCQRADHEAGCEGGIVAAGKHCALE